MVSNGSFKEEAGAAAWIIKGSNVSMHISGSWHTLVLPSNHSLFHSELAGIVGVLYTLPFWLPINSNPPLCLSCDGLLVVS